MRAEILRELECFDELIKVLQTKKLREYQPDFTSKIKILSKKKDSRVSIIEIGCWANDPFFVSPDVLFPETGFSIIMY